MHYLSFSRKTTMASLTVLALFLLSMILTSAHAQNNPFSATDLTGQSDMGFMELVVFVLVWVVRIVVISAMLFGAGKLLFSIFDSFSQSRERGDWGSFITTVGWGVVLVVVAVAIAGLGWSWSDSILTLLSQRT